MVVFRKPLGKFSGRCRFAGALQADKHDYGGRLRREVEADVFSAQHVNQFVADNFDDLLPWAQALKNILADRLGPHRIGELLDDLEVHIGFEQRDADFLQGAIDVLLG